MIEYIFNIISFFDKLIIDYYFYSFFIYFFTLTFFFTFSLPGGPILLLGSGFFFGFFLGFIINIFSITLGSVLFIYFSKTILRKIYNKFFIKFSNRISNLTSNSSFEYLILLRLLLGTPLILQNICITLLNISKRKIFFSSLVGFSPIIILFTYLGNYCSSIIELKNFTLAQIFSFEILIIIGAIIILIILRIFLKKNINL